MLNYDMKTIKFLLFSPLLSLSDLPPFLGLFPKCISIKSIINNLSICILSSIKNSNSLLNTYSPNTATMKLPAFSAINISFIEEYNQFVAIYSHLKLVVTVSFIIIEQYIVPGHSMG